MLAATMRRSRLGPLMAIAVMAAAVLFLTSCTPEVNAELKTYSGINAIRVQGGLPALTPDAALVKVARARSQDMAAKSYFSHNPPGGCNYVCIMDQYGVPHAWAGENIAWNTWDWSQTADVAVNMWHNSPPHMENIMDCHYTRFGTGVAKGAGGRIYYTMIFEGNRAC
ncbi:MAG: CAP domain-containing protein [Dehalococcoidia bacterium]|nr:MAG: CAP domain-containing protein [Dehalococcoidia bacterium]